ncbi:oligopeptide/dipeptide ABC transporter ATP-binding protein [Geminicoccaceae bacterium 1502E]|nr:oligopeptide/dipeptide ABC transporter ATP-binding protein [Geminicoccaceae bacterium 1502E]
MSPAEPLLRVDDLRVHFPVAAGRHGGRTSLRAVDGVSFNVRRGTTFGIVGESGSGKSTTALAVMRLNRITGGSVRLDGSDLATLQGEALRRLRRRFQIVFQDPYASLNPRLRAGAIVREPLDLMDIEAPERRDAIVAEMLATVGLRPEQHALFPHQFSGGQRQRIAIARALASRPDLLVLDEPVSALDVAIQAQILNLLRRLQKEFGLTYLFISHDLGVVQHMCDELAVMYLGRIVEQGSRREIFSSPRHPYTRALLSAVPTVRRNGPPRIQLRGEPPSPIDPPDGCPFHPRCPMAEALCRKKAPSLQRGSDGQLVACHFAAEMPASGAQHRIGVGT